VVRLRRGVLERSVRAVLASVTANAVGLGKALLC
jgi:hypothetical protein